MAASENEWQRVDTLVKLLFLESYDAGISIPKTKR